MTPGISDGLLAEAGYFRVRESFEESHFCWEREDLGRDPTAIRQTVSADASIAPTFPQLADTARRGQHLAGKEIGLDDIKAELREASRRGGLAATDTARESDDHALPYPPGPPRANLKRGWGKTGDHYRYPRLVYQPKERRLAPAAAPRPVQP